jgi:hypothetical protein
LLSALSLRNRPKTTPTSSPPLLLMMILEFTDTTLRGSSNHLSGRRQIHRDPRKQDKFKAMSNQCWFVFLTLKASCIRNLLHQDWPWLDTSIATFRGRWGKSSGTNVQSSGTTIIGPCTMTMCPATHLWLQQKQQSSPTLPTHQTSPPVIFSYFRKWNWSSGCDVLRALKRSRLNRRTRWRCWRKMTSSSAFDYRNPAGIAVLTQKGTTKKMEANKNFVKWLSLGGRISGTFG